MSAEGSRQSAAPGRTDWTRHIPFAGPANFRDLGGYPAKDGRRTRWRRVFRADGLHRLTPADLLGFERLGIRAIYDLRSDQECLAFPNPMASQQVALERYVSRGEFEDGSVLQEALQAEQRLFEVYLAIVRTAGPLFGELLVALASEEDLPAVFHCAGGKDRTGLLAGMLLTTLGCDTETILGDYELTNSCVTGARRREIIELFVASGMSAEAAAAFIAAPRWVMAETLATLDREYGSVEDYLREEAGIGRETVEALRAQLLD